MTSTIGTRSSNPALIAALLATLLATTLTVGFLLVDAESRTMRFWLSISSLLLAELLMIGYPLLLSIDAQRDTVRLPVRFGVFTTLLGYGIAGVVLAFVALSPISMTWLLMLHVMTLGILISMLLILRIMGNKIHQSASELADNTQFMRDLRRRVGVLKLNRNLSVEVLQAMSHLNESARYSNPESSPSTRIIETRLNEALIAIEACSDKAIADAMTQDDFLALIASMQKIMGERELIMPNSFGKKTTN